MKRKSIKTFICILSILFISSIFVGCKSDLSYSSTSNSQNILEHESSEDNNSEIISDVIMENTTDTSKIVTESSTSENQKSEVDYAGEIAPEIVRIVEAYKTGDESKLTDNKDIFVLSKAKEIINLVIKDGMSDYEKELAIHDYIVKNTHYDTDELNEHVEVDPDSFTAYGLLKNGKSVCLGYTRTFQLFMDILDIECLTIHSSYNFV